MIPCSSVYPGNHYSANPSIELANSTLQHLLNVSLSEKKNQMITLGYSNEKKEKKQNQNSA
ncbi:hypothetical protein LEP1GSC178_0905 [Leptospira licerasiae str. MMD4847]|uniref:Uncharacterized protein n=1 Tax=Leptospira licerasiae str. MMD4847 TaxID=1049971 RepID=A0ABP2RFU2_9LEPT|nr:hypothetical protein LEP1GSC178_0905 [Leptospira licerasiae str. MMD4847]